MKFLLNENIPPSLSSLLQTVGWNASHANQLGLNGKSDIYIVEFAIQNEFVIITHDLDYSRIVSLSGKDKPSVLSFRLDSVSVNLLFKLISLNRIQLEHYLQMGALVSIDEKGFRFRALPVVRSS
jgi:predicted nuclease of predicted toxin-antitoxin system